MHTSVHPNSTHQSVCAHVLLKLNVLKCLLTEGLSIVIMFIISFSAHSKRFSQFRSICIYDSPKKKTKQFFLLLGKHFCFDSMKINQTFIANQRRSDSTCLLHWGLVELWRIVSLFSSPTSQVVRCIHSPPPHPLALSKVHCTQKNQGTVISVVHLILHWPKDQHQTSDGSRLQTTSICVANAHLMELY